jgi:hypothetical protein
VVTGERRVNPAGKDDNCVFVSGAPDFAADEAGEDLTGQFGIDSKVDHRMARVEIRK